MARTDDDRNTVKTVAKESRYERPKSKPINVSQQSEKSIDDRNLNNSSEISTKVDKSQDEQSTKKSNGCLKRTQENSSSKSKEESDLEKPKVKPIDISKYETKSPNEEILKQSDKMGAKVQKSQDKHLDKNKATFEKQMKKSDDSFKKMQENTSVKSNSANLLKAMREFNKTMTKDRQKALNSIVMSDADSIKKDNLSHSSHKHKSSRDQHSR